MRPHYMGLVGPVVLVASTAAAQEPAPPPPQSAVTAERSPGQLYLMEVHGISAAQAAERLQLQESVAQTAQRLAAEFPQDFGGVWIEHEPVYRIIVAFKSAEQRSAVRDTIPPQQRRFVQIKNVRQSVAEREATADLIIAALNTLGIRYVSYYEHKTDDVVVEVGSDQSIGRVRQALPPGLRDSVKVIRGNIPVPLQATGAVSSDYVYPGFWWAPNSGGSYACTFSFAVKDNQNREGILTAGHCPVGPAYLYRANPSPHWITLAAAAVN